MKGLPLDKIIELFRKTYYEMCRQGYFTEAFGYECVDEGVVAGKIFDPELDILVKVRKDNWSF